MNKLRISFEEFAARVEKAYNGRISVVEETYTGIRKEVTAYCNVHKIYFKALARNLERGHVNCPECSKIKRQEINKSKVISFSEMLKRFREAYGDKFSYDESSYHGGKELMKVHCNDCGEDFEITPEHHLKYNNGGCPNCHKTKIVKCSKCGKDMVVDRRSSINANHMCEECKHKHKKRIQKERYCKICGRLIITSGNHRICQNEFCQKHKHTNFKNLVSFGFDISRKCYGKDAVHVDRHTKVSQVKQNEPQQDQLEQ